MSFLYSLGGWIAGGGVVPEEKIMRLPAILAALTLAALPTAASADYACYQECAQQGYERSYCMTVCERTGGNRAGTGGVGGMGGIGPGLIQQPGAPRNPYLDSLSDPAPRQQPVPRTDPKCLDDCRAKGYKYQLCRKQCSY